MKNRAKPMPEDLTLRYRWCEGSVPPPDYYEYAIELGPGGGRIDFCPDYPGEGVCVWAEEFEVEGGALASMYELLVESHMFRGTWTEIEDPPVGGSQEWLEIEARGVIFRVPSMVEESVAVREVYAAIRALVPDDVWGGLMERWERYRDGVGD